MANSANHKEERVYQGSSRIVHLERESRRRIFYELANGFRQTIRVAPALADLIEEAWENFLQTPGESDSPGG